MAASPSHKFGQELGNLLEDLVLNKILLPRLLEFTKSKNYYLDWQKDRKARKGKKVTWNDKYGNTHDLDFVIEANGTEDLIGRPLAFIEAAWRRYTKHSKNKAQEIQGAILPIRELYELSAPFIGVILAGEFTEPSLRQLENNRFAVLYIPYDDVIKAFEFININISFDEDTEDSDYVSAIQQIAEISIKKKTELLDSLIKISFDNIEAFMNKLRAALERYIISVAILPLFGNRHEFPSVEDAIKKLENLDINHPIGTFAKFEVIVDYNNNDIIRASFSEKESLITFLKTVQC
ncbi:MULTISPECIES: hypothetical protein [Parachlamydia]|jgi:hypothetical protein|uniref:hypothetical protein n=1 Tax=Parachlamydia TaxID=83551 RepID=UPI0002FB2C51|nr:hypothetical protein [Parachlamydia acanthamoebae]